MVVDDFLKSSVGNFKRIKNKEDSFIYFKHQDIPNVSVLMTDGLSQFRMDVHEKHTGEEYAELYFLLPVYWEEKDLYKKENEWVFYCLSKIKNHVETNNTWVEKKNMRRNHREDAGKKGHTRGRENAKPNRLRCAGVSTYKV